MWWVGVAAAAVYGGGDWGGADLVLVQGDSASGVFTNVGRFVVPAGVTVPVTGALEVHAREVEISGTLDASGSGSDGGRVGGPVDGSGPAGGEGASGRRPGAGGGGHGGAGGAGAAGGGCGAGYAGGAEVGDPWAGAPGSGGGANHRPGGDGGGTVWLEADRVVVGVTGTVRADGRDGGGSPSTYDGGGPGGGAGGGVVLEGASEVRVTGALSARGGAGGEGYAYGGCPAGGGGGGGGGRVVVRGPFSGDAGRWSVAGGQGAPSDGAPAEGLDGEAGTVWIEDRLAAGAPRVALAGVCPGVVELSVAGASAFARLEVWRGSGPGAATLPTGPCAGVGSGLAAPVRVGSLTADAAGEAAAARSLGAAGCGVEVVVVDTWTCAVSAPEVTP